MKWNFTVLTIVFVSMSCSNSVSSDVPIPTLFPVQIDFQSGFQGDSVIVRIDGIVISAKRHTSDAAFGYADSAVGAFAEGKHVLFVNSPELKSKIDTTYVQLNAKTYLGISYLRAPQNWTYLYSTKPFVYVGP
jgi:hypothetical protein